MSPELDDERFDREERAFTGAFRDALGSESFRPLDADDLKAAAGPASGFAGRWAKGMAAAAALVLVAIGAAVVLPQLARGGVSASSATVAAAPEPAGGAAPKEADDRVNVDSRPEATMVANGSPTGSLEPGFRWESYRDVQVQVPVSWGYAAAPNSDYCVREAELPTKPYVDLTRGNTVVAAILCGEELPDSRQAMHLSFSPANAAAPWSAPSKVWQQYSRELGAARLTVTAKADQVDLANRILESAKLVPDADPNGCPTALPDPPPVALSPLDASRISVCLYEASDDRGAFRSSVELTGPAAANAWRAVLAAPGGGGPNLGASSCGTGQGWPVLLLVGADRVPVSGSVAGCDSNGIADASARGRLRALTGEVCRALLVDPVRIWTGYGPSAEFCVR
jgi:hypothetical protein